MPEKKPSRSEMAKQVYEHLRLPATIFILAMTVLVLVAGPMASLLPEAPFNAWRVALIVGTIVVLTALLLVAMSFWVERKLKEIEAPLERYVTNDEHGPRLTPAGQQLCPRGHVVPRSDVGWRPQPTTVRPAPKGAAFDVVIDDGVPSGDDKTRRRPAFDV